MSVHYKFKSALEYDTVTFDGLHISVKDLKKAIIHQKRIGKTTDFDLQVTNAQTKEVYTDENALIPKNTSLVIARVPLAAQSKGKPWEGYGNQAGGAAGSGLARSEDGALSKAVDLTQLDASEDDKIRAMMTQSTLDYDPSNYMKIRGSNQVGIVPSHYRCFKCHQPGHWIKDCPLGHGQEPMEIKKSTGIPRSFMVPVEGPMVPGAMMTPTGQYAVPVLDHQAYTEGNKATAPIQEEKVDIPEDLVCNVCKDLLTDAVMIPCCGNSFCDECIRTVLLESEDHECPDCHEKDISPGTLIPNRFLRNSVSNFKNETGYHKRQQYRNAVITQVPAEEPQIIQSTPLQEPLVVHPAESTTEILEQPKPDSQSLDLPVDPLKPIISEADSTETTKNAAKEEIQQKCPSPKVEGPPGVESPGVEKTNEPVEESPPGVDSAITVSNALRKQPRKKGQAITSVGSAVNHHRVKNVTTSQQNNQLNANPDASLHHRHYVPPAYSSESNSRNMEERPGTPTVDEPGIGPPGYSGSDHNYNDTLPPGLQATTTTLPPSQHMHPPPQIQGVPTYPTSTAPPPHFAPNNPVQGAASYRLPPPEYRAFPAPPRALYDSARPPVPFDPHRAPVHGAPPPGYPAYPAGPRPAIRPFPPPRHLHPLPPGMRMPLHNPPTHVIDDPLEAFNRMLREKDERDRRTRQRQSRRMSRSRSYSRSRSSSRSFSRSPRSRTRSPPPRNRHRSRTRSPPLRIRRDREPRSRSRSFTISRSRSFSRSPSYRGSPARDFSPRRRPSSSRYRSPLNRNSPQRYHHRYKDSRGVVNERERDRFLDRDRNNSRNDHQEYQYYDRNATQDFEYEEARAAGSRHRAPLLRNPRYGVPPVPRKDFPPAEPFYQPTDMCPPAAFPPHSNRYNSRGQTYPPPLMSVKTIPPLGGGAVAESTMHRKFDDLAPPGVEEPPVPGFESQRYEARYPAYDRPKDDGPPGVDRYPKMSPYPPPEEHRDLERPTRPEVINREYREKIPTTRDVSTEEKDRCFERKYSPSLDKRRQKSVSPKRSSRERHSSPDRSRRRKRDESSDRDRRQADSRTESDRDRDKDKDKKDKKRDVSEDEKTRKSKDKKKKKERKEAERKKKKEKKEKKEQEKLKKAEEKKAKELVEEKENIKSDDVSNEEKTQLNESISVCSKPVLVEMVEQQPEIVEQQPERIPNIELYDDILSEHIDNSVVENYGKIEEKETSPVVMKEPIEEELVDDDDDDSEEKDASFDGLELQANELDLKTEFNEVKSKEMLAPLPELSKWERDDDVLNTPEKCHHNEIKTEPKQIFERSGKVVTSEVLKRAENAIFAKAINAIRPIEIKKISLDRVKLYSGEKSEKNDSLSTKEPVKNIQITIPGWNLEELAPPGTESVELKSPLAQVPSTTRLSVKERLGCKVEELDKMNKDEKPFEKNRSRTLSPLSRRIDDNGRNVALGERRLELDGERRRTDYRRHEQRPRHNEYDRDRHTRHRSRSRDGKTTASGYINNRERRQPAHYARRGERSRSRHRRYDYRDREHRDRDPKEKEKITSRNRKSKSRSPSKDLKDRDKRKKIKDRKVKKEKEKEKVKEKETKGKKHKKEDQPEEKDKPHESKALKDVESSKSTTNKTTEKAKAVESRRKPTLDEANFEPDYDLETESEKEDNPKLKTIDSSASKKRDRSKSAEKKAQESSSIKKRKTEETDRKTQKESSSSESSDSSSDERHKKKHKKHKKKKSKRDSSSSSSSSESDSSVDRKAKKRHKTSKKLKKKKKSKHK